MPRNSPRDSVVYLLYNLLEQHYFVEINARVYILGGPLFFRKVKPHYVGSYNMKYL